MLGTNSLSSSFQHENLTLFHLKFKLECALDLVQSICLATAAQTPFIPHSCSSVRAWGRGRDTPALQEVMGHITLEASRERWMVATGQAAPMSSPCPVTEERLGQSLPTQPCGTGQPQGSVNQEAQRSLQLREVTALTGGAPGWRWGGCVLLLGQLLCRSQAGTQRVCACSV